MNRSNGRMGLATFVFDFVPGWYVTVVKNGLVSDRLLVMEMTMLHMVTLSHGPDTCAAVHSEIGAMARKARSEIDATAKGLGITVQGWWVDAPGHVFYLLADAPHAHAVNKLMTEVQLFLWNTIDIHPIVTIDEAMPLAAS